MALFGSLIISLVIHVVISADCDKTAFPDDVHGKFVFKPDEATIPDGGLVTVICTTPGYEPTDGDGRKIRCINGTWDGTLHTCKPAKCPKQNINSQLMDHAVYKFKNDSGGDKVENGTLATVECDKGYRMMKKTVNGDYEQTEFSDDDVFFCHYSVWVIGRKAIDLRYRCDPMGKVLLIGSFDNSIEYDAILGGRTIMELYDTQNPENNQLVNEPLPAMRFRHNSGVFDDGLVAIVGGMKDGFLLTLDTDFYNPKLGTFVTGPPLDVLREYSASVMLNNEMIICGGMDGNTPLSSCAKLFYDESSEAYKWITHTASMNHARSSHVMTKFNNDLFVFGGDANSTAERYVKARNAWDIITPMPTNRSPVAAATLGGIIYTCGDYDSTSYPICEKYDPVASNWVGSTAPINTSVSWFNLVAMEKEGKLYAFGHNNVEWFDPTTGLWAPLMAHTIKFRNEAQAVQLKPN